MIPPASVPTCRVEWRGARRIIRSPYPPIDLFEDLADPADWPLLISAEMKTNPRLMETIGNLDLVPQSRRVAGPGASYLMAPFTHTSPDRPSRFTDGRLGVLYAAGDFETALFETIHHHERFMSATAEPAGWTSTFREIVFDVAADLNDLRSGDPAVAPLLDPDEYGPAQAFAVAVRAAGAEGVVYPSVRRSGASCVALFHPDLAGAAVQGRHLDYHWDGSRVNYVREHGAAATILAVE
ncbi:RES family NAD+ phosphorylase [Roseomonas sp. GCM10028921]